MKFITEPATEARRAELLAKRTEMEGQIAVTVDPGAASALRADYRAIVNELDLYYDDIPEGQ